MRNILTRRIGISLSVLAFTVFFENLIEHYNAVGSFEAIGFNYVTLVVGVLSLSTCFFSIGKYFQVACFSVTCLLTFFEDPESGFALIQIVILTLLSFKYGFLKKNLILKIVGAISVVFTTMFVSAYWHGHSLIYVLATLLFFSIFVFLIFLIMSDEIKINIKREKRLKAVIKKLNHSLVDTKEHLKSIGAYYIDPIEAGLTKAELLLLENLCIYRESNIDLGERLGKSPNTIKVQLTKVMEKIGADTRYQLIDLCKNYYLGDQPVII